ncbi:repair protein [Dehalogenimonas sp. WBC-2]|nr:repair protein [Dehalogenimonas sp. WBC-2]
MSENASRFIEFQMEPQLLTKQLGSDLYPSSGEALCQLIANALDAGSSQVRVTVKRNDLDAPQEVVISDDGMGITIKQLDQAYRCVGKHFQPYASKRETIGSRGIGRFAVFALAPESYWRTVALEGTQFFCHEWTLVEGSLKFQVTSKAVDEKTGTTVTLPLKQNEGISRLFGGTQSVKRLLFNAFACYLFRYENEVSIFVDDEPVKPSEFVERSESEEIPESEKIPQATLRHLVLGRAVDQECSSLLRFSTHGTTISSKPIEGEPIPGSKYLGLVDSPYLSDLTNTAKSELAHLDKRFLELEKETITRAQRYILTQRANRVRSFLEEAREKPYYPYKEPPRTIIDSTSQQLYDGILMSLETGYGIRSLQPKQQRLVFILAKQLLQSEDLADVLTSVLGLSGDEITKFADLLKRTSLSSVIAISELLVGRFQFINELKELIYGASSVLVKERQHLHKIIEGHTWIFGEQFHLLGSDVAINTLLPIINSVVKDATESEAFITVGDQLRDIPDLYLMGTKWNEGSKYHQHLIVEMKRPSIKIVAEHIEQLKRYASKIVQHPMFAQQPTSHRFTFICVSSDVSENVQKTEYQANEEPGLLGRPHGFGHPTELWALRWSDLLDRRTGEMNYLKDRIVMQANPSDLEYLREQVAGFLPKQVLEQINTSI